VAPVPEAHNGGIWKVPIFDICIILPSTAGCPTGIEAVFDLADPPVLKLPPGPAVNVVFVDSDRANQVLVGFTVDPPATADVKYWRDGVSPGVVEHASSLGTVNVLGQTVLVARLDTLASTTYKFEAVAGNGLMSGASPVGSFTTGSGVEQFDVALASTATPKLALQAGLSPYLHPSAGAFAQPMIRLADAGGSCALAATFGSAKYCVDTGVTPQALPSCPTVTVSYALSGIDAEGVYVRAFPTETGVTPDGSMTLGGVIEVAGPAPSGTASVGCLASGMTYTIALDAAGDDRGILATKTVTVP
jgi:hypothetical protein